MAPGWPDMMGHICHVDLNLAGSCELGSALTMTIVSAADPQTTADYFDLITS